MCFDGSEGERHAPSLQGTFSHLDTADAILR